MNQEFISLSTAISQDQSGTIFSLLQGEIMFGLFKLKTLFGNDLVVVFGIRGKVFWDCLLYGVIWREKF